MLAPASSKTGTGITAGPALKLKIRSVMTFNLDQYAGGVRAGLSKLILSHYATVAPLPRPAVQVFAAPAAHSPPSDDWPNRKSPNSCRAPGHVELRPRLLPGFAMFGPAVAAFSTLQKNWFR